MKKLAVVVVVFIALTVFSQTRTEEYLASNVKIEEIVLRPLSDGGCTAHWQGYVNSKDGGHILNGVTPVTDLRTAAMQTRCDVLKQAGEGRLAVTLRLQIDGGAP